MLQSHPLKSKHLILYWVIQCESFEAFGKHGDFVSLDERGASADALFLAAAGVERDAGNTVVQHLFHQVGSCEAGIAEGEIETVSDRFAAVLVVGDVEAVFGESFLHQFCLSAIFQHVVTVVVSAVVNRFQDGGEGMLC